MVLMIDYLLHLVYVSMVITVSLARRQIFLERSRGNDIHKTNVPNLRIAFRHEVFNGNIQDLVFYFYFLSGTRMYHELISSSPLPFYADMD